MYLGIYSANPRWHIRYAPNNEQIGYANPAHSTEVWEQVDIEARMLTQLKVSYLYFLAQVSLFSISIPGTRMCRIRVFLTDFDDDYAIISRKKLIFREKENRWMDKCIFSYGSETKRIEAKNVSLNKLTQVSGNLKKDDAAHVLRACHWKCKVIQWQKDTFLNNLQ